MRITKFDLEGRVRRIVELVQTKQYSEDDFVEFKAQWPPQEDLNKWARRIAGHCNAAMGHPVLWIVGVDEKSGTIGCTHVDRANWIPQLTSYFEDGFAPGIIHDLNIPVGKSSVTALLFESDRAPYVVKVVGGSISREVPWRSGTAIRSARREDLVRMLYARKQKADVTVLLGEADLLPKSPDGDEFNISVTIGAYIIPPANTRFVWPFHQCGMRIYHEGPLKEVFTGSTISAERIEVSSIVMGGLPHIDSQAKRSNTLAVTRHEVVLSGPNCIYIKAYFPCRLSEFTPELPLHVRAALIDAEDKHPTVVDVLLFPCIDDSPKPRLTGFRARPQSPLMALNDESPLLRALGFCK